MHDFVYYTPTKIIFGKNTDITALYHHTTRLFDHASPLRFASAFLEAVVLVLDVHDSILELEFPLVSSAVDLKLRNNIRNCCALSYFLQNFVLLSRITITTIF